jgi:predicted naringenin-chalcone synthase
MFNTSDLRAPAASSITEEHSPATRARSVLPHLAGIGIAAPPHDIHGTFAEWAESQLPSARERRLFQRMVERAEIEHRWSVLEPGVGGSPADDVPFYAGSRLPGTEARMQAYAAAAPRLALQAVEDLAARAPLGDISHLVVASCTGFIAPGVDQIIAAELGLRADLERTLIGFMGCYAAVVALRTACHIVRSDPDARVLVVTVELSSLHLREDRELEPLLASLLFGDGAAAAVVSAEPAGLAVTRFFCRALPDSQDLIRWAIGDQGFAMHLSGEVPGRIAQALGEPEVQRALLGGARASEIDAWAVHAGGRSVLDAVQGALKLPPEALEASRSVLRDYGNMSSSTLMFILSRLFDRGAKAGVALAFGPGLTAEGFEFRSAG